MVIQLTIPLPKTNTTKGMQSTRVQLDLAVRNLIQTKYNMMNYKNVNGDGKIYLVQVSNHIRKYILGYA